MTLLTRESILAAADITYEDVAVPEWGGIVRVSGLTGTERDSFELSMLEGKGRNQSVNLQNLRAKLVTFSVINEDGKRMFTESDIVALGNKSASALQRVFAVAQRLSGLDTDAVDELTKSLGKESSDDSGSNSPSLSVAQ